MEAGPITVTLLNDKNGWLFQLPRGELRVVSNGREFLRLMNRFAPGGPAKYLSEEVCCDGCEYWWISLRRRGTKANYRCAACQSRECRVSRQGWH